MELATQIFAIILYITITFSIIILIRLKIKNTPPDNNSAKKEVENILENDKLPQDLEEFLKKITGSENIQMWEVKVPVKVKKVKRSLKETIIFHNIRKLEAVERQDFEEAQRIQNIITQLQKNPK